MTELYHEAIAWYNLPLTTLLCLVLLYWIVACFGIVGDGLELDLSTDGDVDVDGNPSAMHGISSAFTALLRFVNMDQVPVMIVISLLTMSMWTIAIIGNYFFTGAGNVLAAILVLTTSFILSLFITKAITTPIAKVLRKVKAGDKATEEPIVGRSGFVRSGSISTETGQVEIEMRGAPLLINAQLREGNARLKKGDECLIIDEDEATGIYYVKAL